MNISSYASTIADLFINLSVEYGAILEAIFLVCAAAGVLIVASGIMSVIKAGDRQKQQPVWGVVAAKCFGGASLTDLSFWANSWTSTLWANTDPLDIGIYSAAAHSDYSEQALYAALGMMVIAGYVSLASAYFSITALGHVSQEGRGAKVASIVSRVVAGSALIMSVHVASLFNN